MRIGGFNLRSFSRTSTESTQRGESAHTAPTRETNAMVLGATFHAAGQGDREAIPSQSPSGTRPVEVERFLDSAALSAIKFPTPDFNRYTAIDKAAESVEDFTRDLYRHSPTFRKAVHKATGAGTAQPHGVRIVLDKLPSGCNGAFYNYLGEVHIDQLQSNIQVSPHTLHGIGIFELLNAASREHYMVFDKHAVSGEYEKRAQHPHYSRYTPEQLYARDNEYEEWLNGKKHHQIFMEARSGLINTSAGF